MVTKQFQIGDIVERINGEHAGMKIGDVGEIIGIECDKITLKNFRGYDKTFGHDSENLKLVSKKDVLSSLELW